MKEFFTITRMYLAEKLLLLAFNIASGKCADGIRLKSKVVEYAQETIISHIKNK
jgi:hypothetical protein